MSFMIKILKRQKYLQNATMPENSFTLKPFSQVPGPAVIPLLGSAWKYFPIIGNWDVNRLHITGELKLLEFGPIVREEVSSDLCICHVFRPEDIEKVYKVEGQNPQRRSHLALMHYRNERPKFYKSGGLLPVNGEEWSRLRSTFQKHLAINHARSFLPAANEIVSEFITNVLDNNSVIEDFLSLSSRLYLEIMWMFVFGKRLRSFDSVNMKSDSIPSKIIEAAEEVNMSTLKTDGTEKIWKQFKTPLYKKMERNLEFIEKIVLDALRELINEKQSTTKAADSQSCLIEKYLQIPNVDMKDINGMTVDLVLGGVDTTSYTTSFLLYNLSRNPNIQMKLKSEAKNLLKTVTCKVDSTTLNSAVYARAVLKESFRLNPITIGVSRYLLQDTVFSNYLIPKGTLMLTQNMVACRRKEYFKNPESYIPERWIQSLPEYENVSPFLVLPFSHGPRTCIARRLAEQNILTFLLLVGRNYSISWVGREKIGIITPLICKPDKPIRLKFVPWERS